MESATESVVVQTSPQDALDRWMAFTGRISPAGADRPSQNNPDAAREKHSLDNNKGRITFTPEGSGTRITMTLHYNPAALREAGLSVQWLTLRIALFLQRFKAQVES